MNKKFLLSCVDRVRCDITNGDINKAILIHFDLLMDTYQRKPLFYKHILKYDRLMVTLCLLSFSFRNSEIPLSRVKDFCQNRGYMSANSLDTFFSFFEITGYMKIISHCGDARQRLYRPTEMALSEAQKIIDACFKPSEIIIPLSERVRHEIHEINSKTQLERYYKGLAVIFESNILLDQLLPEAKWIMNRDGGYLPMLAIYVDSMRVGVMRSDLKVGTYNDLSSRLGVSKTHIIRMIKEGEVRGYFKCNKHKVVLCPSFFQLVHRLMATYFAIARVSMELGVVWPNISELQPENCQIIASHWGISS